MCVCVGRWRQKEYQEAGMDYETGYQEASHEEKREGDICVEVTDWREVCFALFALLYSEWAEGEVEKWCQVLE